MLIRFRLNNIYSFGKEKEFAMISAPRFSRLNKHKYHAGSLEILKLSAFYGANGAGKSNLVKALDFFKSIVVTGKLPSSLALRRLRFFHESTTPTLLGVEFVTEGIPYLYALEIGEQNILKEEFYVSGLNEKEDKLIFERTTNQDGTATLKFADSKWKLKENKMLQKIIEQNLLKQNIIALKVLAELENPSKKETNQAYDWFRKKLVILTPSSVPSLLVQKLDIDKEFRTFAEGIICSYGVGIKKLKTEKKNIKDFFGDDNPASMESVLNKMDENQNSAFEFRNPEGETFDVVRENGAVVVKQLKTMHTRENGQAVLFDLGEESEGSRRLLDFLPAFTDVIASDTTCIIDEIERSIHPLLIKEIIKKFSFDDTTKGQLVFTTHESNLLDQEILRQDEIWFVEKDSFGDSDLYSLCDFKEHNTKDIRKGYLEGRYGAIPFLANLRDLNWDKYDFQK
ncbi:MAG: AAA family ATPase [Spirochaetia bacterium]|jgi:AAA15 family ATPase/GTPase|nr:AAA family ATPase [Spirochaetia bacterium]